MEILRLVYDQKTKKKSFELLVNGSVVIKEGNEVREKYTMALCLFYEKILLILP